MPSREAYISASITPVRLKIMEIRSASSSTGNMLGRYTRNAVCDGVAPYERATVRYSTRTDSTAVVVDMMTIKMVEKKPKPTFSTKPTPNTRMNIGRKIDFGIEKAKNSSGFTTSAK